MNSKVTISILVAVAAGVGLLVVGAAYGDRIPLVNKVYPKLPGSRA